MQPPTAEAGAPPVRRAVDVQSHPLPCISVVVPCFNAAEFVEATLASIVAQQGVVLDVVVVDDGSSDDSAARVARGFPQVRLIRQANAGVSAARNAGLRAARSDWVAFCDADDLWLPGKLAAQWAVLQAQPEAGMAYAGWHVWHSREAAPAPGLLDELQSRHGAQAHRPSGWIYPELLVDCVVWTSTVLARRSLLLELGGFDEGLRVGEDYDLWLRASRRTPIASVSRPLALYRMHDDNTTRRVPSANHKAGVVQRALDRWGYVGPDGRAADRKAVAAGLARSWSDFAGAQLGGGNSRTAIAAAWRAIRISPARRLGWQVLLHACIRNVATRVS